MKTAYPDQFDKIGNFSGTVKLFLKQNVKPFVDLPQKCSIRIKEKLKAVLDEMVEQGVIREVEEHTDWCSSLTYGTKKDGSLRIYLDPQRLCASLRRCPHIIHNFVVFVLFKTKTTKTTHTHAHKKEEC